MNLPRFKLRNWFRINKKAIISSIVTFFISFMLGGIVVATNSYISEKIKLLINRPHLSVKFQKIELNEFKRGSWELVSYFRINNIGNSPTLVNISSIEILFPEYSNIPFDFKLDKSMRIPRKDYIDDTVYISLPVKFEINSDKKIPVIIRNIKLHLNQDGGEEYSIIADSSDIKQISHSFSGDLRNEYLEFLPKDVFYDSTTSTYKTAHKRFYINYKGMDYPNYVYPLKTKMDYEIRNDSIVLLPSYENKVSADSFIQIRQFSFIINPKIADKIIIPKKPTLIVTAEYIKEEKREFEDISIDVDKFFIKYETQIIYYFNN